MSKFDRFRAPSTDVEVVPGMTLSAFMSKREKPGPSLTDEEREVLIAELEAMKASGSTRVPTVKSYKPSQQSILDEIPRSVKCTSIDDMITAIRNHEGFEDIFRFRKQLGVGAPKATELLDREEKKDPRIDRAIADLNAVINEFGLYSAEKMSMKCINLNADNSRHTATDLIYQLKTWPNSELSRKVVEGGWHHNLMSVERSEYFSEAVLYGVMEEISPHRAIEKQLDQAAAKVGAPQEKVEKVLGAVAEKITNLFKRKK